MNSAEVIFYWIATLASSASFLLIILFYVFKKGKTLEAARLCILLAFVSLTIFGIYRWVEWHHPPFVTLFESMITAVWFMLLLYFIIFMTSRSLSILLLPVSLATFLLMGWSSSLPAAASSLSEALDNTWLFIHATFATLGAASLLMAASLALLFIIGEQKLEAFRTSFHGLPRYSDLAHSISNFVLIGFIFWGIMIVSGSIWAHTAWGRYWGWDPIELWSLISWLLYGLIFHARLAFKIKTRLFAWLVIAAVFTVTFALWGISYVYETIHSYG